MKVAGAAVAVVRLSHSWNSRKTLQTATRHKPRGHEPQRHVPLTCRRGLVLALPPVPAYGQAVRQCRQKRDRGASPDACYPL